MDKKLIEKYFTGKCTPEEKQKVEAFLSENENLGDVLDDSFQKLWENEKDFAVDEIFPSMLFNEIESKIQTNDMESIHEHKKTRRINVRSLLKYAAMLLLVGFFGFLAERQYSHQGAVTVAQETIVKKTSNGQKSTILLSDGSKIILNSGSSVTYPKYFTDSSRVLKLKGEAYFEVAKDVSRPFSVIAQGIRTTALGTSFNINALDSKVKVSLATGKVVVKEEQSEFVSDSLYFLIPGQSIQFNNDSKKITKSNFIYDEDFLWKDGVLYFKNASMAEIQKRLGTWYDVQFTVKNNTQSEKKYTGQFNNEVLKNVLENMSFALGFDYFLNGKKVEIIFSEKSNM